MEFRSKLWISLILIACYSFLIKLICLKAFVEVLSKRSENGVYINFYRVKKFIDAKNDSANVIAKYLIQNIRFLKSN